LGVIADSSVAASLSDSTSGAATARFALFLLAARCAHNTPIAIAIAKNATPPITPPIIAPVADGVLLPDEETPTGFELRVDAGVEVDDEPVEGEDVPAGVPAGVEVDDEPVEDEGVAAGVEVEANVPAPGMLMPGAA
jgi:hypothetical protein